MNNAQQVKFYYNTDNKKLYKVINCKQITMWYRSRQEWRKCATTAREVLEGYYAGRYQMVNERKLGDYK